jgi:hypothetical protein
MKENSRKLKSAKQKNLSKNILSDFVVLRPESSKRKLSDEIVITPKGRISFPSASIYKEKKKELFCSISYSEGKQELLFFFGEEGLFKVKNGTIELYAVLKKNGLLPEEKIYRKFFCITLDDGVQVFVVRLRESEQCVVDFLNKKEGKDE